jgi:hypothetical protein
MRDIAGADMVEVVGLGAVSGFVWGACMSQELLEAFSVTKVG